jgi:hypothetical protein
MTAAAVRRIRGPQRSWTPKRKSATTDLVPNKRAETEHQTSQSIHEAAMCGTVKPI